MLHPNRTMQKRSPMHLNPDVIKNPLLIQGSGFTLFYKVAQNTNFVQLWSLKNTGQQYMASHVN